MISPNEIRSKQFSKSISGYKIDEVEAFLNAVAADYTKMLTDNAELIKKIEVVVNKLEEYRGNEESISNALLNAQKINEQVIREGKNKAELIIREATFKAERLIKNAQKEVDSQNETLQMLQKEVSGFKSRIFAIYKTHLDLIDKLPSYDSQEPEVEQPQEVDVQDNLNVPSEPEVAETVEAVEAVEAVETVEAVEVEEAVEEILPTEEIANDSDDEEETDDGQIIFNEPDDKFKDLKFGNDYEDD